MRANAAQEYSAAEGKSANFRQSLDRASNRESKTEDAPERAETKSAEAKTPAAKADGRSKTTVKKKPAGDDHKSDSCEEETGEAGTEVRPKAAKTDREDADTSDESISAEDAHHAANKRADENPGDADPAATAEQAALLQTPNTNPAIANNPGTVDTDAADTAAGVDVKAAVKSGDLAEQAAAISGQKSSTDVESTESGQVATTPESPIAAQLKTRAATRAGVQSKGDARLASGDTESDVRQVGGSSATASKPEGAGFDLAAALSEIDSPSDEKGKADLAQPLSDEDLTTSPQGQPNGTSQASHSNTVDRNAKTPDSSATTPEARFAAANHDNVVTGAKAELLPNGGTMKLRLDPPELGTMQVSLHMRDGVVTASFQTNNDEATRLVSHTLADLRSTLEANGIVVDKLQVQQTPKDESGRDAGSRDQGGRAGQPTTEDPGARRDQQRKDMVQRLWDKLAGNDPLDMVA